MNESFRKEGKVALSATCLLFIIFGFLTDLLIFSPDSKFNIIDFIVLAFVAALSLSAAFDAYESLVKAGSGRSMGQKSLKTQRIYRLLTQHQISPERTIVVALDADDTTAISFETKLPIPACTHFRVGDKPEEITPLNVSTAIQTASAPSGVVATV